MEKLDNFPYEILVNIFIQLDLATIKCLVTLNKTISDVVTSDFFWENYVSNNREAYDTLMTNLKEERDLKTAKKLLTPFIKRSGMPEYMIKCFGDLLMDVKDSSFKEESLKMLILDFGLTPTRIMLQKAIVEKKYDFVDFILNYPELNVSGAINEPFICLVDQLLDADVVDFAKGNGEMKKKVADLVWKMANHPTLKFYNLGRVINTLKRWNQHELARVLENKSNNP